MARTIDKDKFLNKIPDQFKGAIRTDNDLKTASDLWKLDEDLLRTLFSSIPEKLKPLFDWKLTKPAGKRGNRSNIPYDTETIKLATELMKCHPGATISADEGLTGSLLTVQVLIKLDVNGQTKTVSISNIQKVESKK